MVAAGLVGHVDSQSYALLDIFHGYPVMMHTLSVPCHAPPSLQHHFPRIRFSKSLGLVKHFTQLACDLPPPQPRAVAYAVWCCQCPSYAASPKQLVCYQSSVTKTQVVPQRLLRTQELSETQFLASSIHPKSSRCQRRALLLLSG